MKIIIIIVAIILIAGFFGFIALYPSIIIESPYAVLGYGSAAIYMTIRNLGLNEICLVKVEVMEPPGLAAMLHTTIVENGIARMKSVDRICIGPLGTFELRRGGYHIMLGGDIGEVDSFKVKLIFSDGREVIVIAPVKGGLG